MDGLSKSQSKMDDLELLPFMETPIFMGYQWDTNRGDVASMTQDDIFWDMDPITKIEDTRNGTKNM